MCAALSLVSLRIFTLIFDLEIIPTTTMSHSESFGVICWQNKTQFVWQSNFDNKQWFVSIAAESVMLDWRLLCLTSFSTNREKVYRVRCLTWKCLDDTVPMLETCSVTHIIFYMKTARLVVVNCWPLPLPANRERWFQIIFFPWQILFADIISQLVSETDEPSQLMWKIN